MTGDLDHIARELKHRRNRGMIVSRSAHTVRHLRGSCLVCSLLSLEVATPKNKSSHSMLSSMREQDGTHKVPIPASRSVLS